jgi:hypothetical protein
MKGGVSLDMLLMNKVLEVHADDMQATIQTGIMKTDLQVCTLLYYAEHTFWLRDLTRVWVPGYAAMVR